MSSPIESGTRARTRRAILDAAVVVFARNRAASLSEVADAAGVGRSTLHRYFPERTVLVDALLEDAVEATRRAFDEAALDQGTPSDALDRLVHAHYDLGPRMNFLFTELPEDSWDGNDALEAAHWPVGALFARGQRDGVFDPDLSIEWIIRALWHLMSAGWEAVAEGAMAKHEVIGNIVGTLEFGIRGPRQRA